MQPCKYDRRGSGVVEADFATCAAKKAARNKLAANWFDIVVFRTKFMPAANDNGFPPGLQIAAWKMLRAGMPPQVILSTLDLTACDLTKVQAKNANAHR